MFVSTVAPLSFTGKGANLNIVIAPEECRAGRQGIEGGGRESPRGWEESNGRACAASILMRAAFLTETVLVA